MSDLRVEVEGPVLTATIDREERRNALSTDAMRGLLAALEQAAGDPQVRVVVVTGAGDAVFCSGADLARMAPDSTGLEQHEGRGLLRDVVLAMRRLPVPVVARVQGLCLAGGLGLMMGCDVALASERARFGLPEVNVGLWPFMVSALLERHLSPKHAMDLMLSGERLDAEAAHRVGLVSRVLPDDGFDAAVAAYVARLAAAPPVAVRLGKAAWLTASESPLEPALEAMQAQLSLLATSADAVEGVTAFLQKRPAVWTGR